jgi:hypothetical protein
VSPPDDEPLPPAEERVARFLRGLYEDAPRAGAELSTAVVSTARWQRAVRTPLRAAGSLAGAVLDGLQILVGGRRGDTR